MNTQEYISSGIVESYVLGLLSAQERFEFEQACQAYPEVKAAREAFELSLEKQAMENAVSPPPAIKQKISDAIFSAKQPAAITRAETIAMNKTKSAATGWLRIAAAACFVLLAGSLWWNMSLRNENRELKEGLTESENRIAQIITDAGNIQRNGLKVVGMPGTGNSPQSLATVYWDTTSHDVYLLVNNLPKPASDEQYQLWAILNGQPQDMGFLEIKEKPLQLYRMKNARAAQAFAITLEKKDGNPAPDLTRIFVIGNL